MEIFEALGILSDLRNSVHNIRRLVNQVFINLNQKKFNAFLVKRFFICILFQIQICRFTVQGKAVFMYVGYSVKGTFSTKHPYQQTVGKL